MKRVLWAAFLFAGCGGQIPVGHVDNESRTLPRRSMAVLAPRVLRESDPALVWSAPAPSGVTATALANPVCGNGILEINEGCDDGDTTPGDGCSATCHVEPGYRCKQNIMMGISVCALKMCGDGVIDFDRGEVCDDGNALPGDGCDANCDLEPGFVCRDVPLFIGDVPPEMTVCEPAGCGDGVVEPGEECDDHNVQSDDGCSSFCTIEPGASCHEEPVSIAPGVAAETSVCTPPQVCGDGIVEPGEECDDGDDNSDALSDECRTDCTLPRCGDGVADSVEACDDGAFNGQPGFCTVACDAYLDPIVADATLVDNLGPSPIEIVGLFPIETPLLEMCTDGFDEVGFGQVSDFVTGSGFIVGRVVQADADFIVQHPIYFLGDVGGGDARPGDTQFMVTSAPEDVTVVEGAVQVRAGDRLAVSISAGDRPPACPCAVGTVTSSMQCTSPTPPEPMPCTGNCPDPIGFDGGHSVTMTTGSASLPVSPLGRSDPFQASCSRICQVAGTVASCDGPGVGSLPPSLTEIPESPCPVDSAPPQIPRMCLYASGESGLTGCPGLCDRPDAVCPEIGADVGTTANECSIEGESWSCEGGFCSCAIGAHQPDPDDVVTARGLADALPWVQLMVCERDSSKPGCPKHDGTDPYVAPHDPSVDILSCAQPGKGGDPQQCLVCSSRLNHGCLPFDGQSRITDPQRTRLKNFGLWPEPTVDDENPNREKMFANEVSMRGFSFDPRKSDQQAGTPPPTSASDPVLLSSGELLIEATDISFPSRGVPFEFTRTYRSGARRHGALGPGWTHNFEERIEAVGDPENRRFAPQYCSAHLPTITCLIHHDGHGGSGMFVFDAATGLFLPQPGEFGAIRVKNDEDLNFVVDSDERSKAPVIVLTEPGGIEKRFDISGVLRSITDEKGFGVQLHWRAKDKKDVERDGAWSGAVGYSPSPYDSRAIAAETAQANRVAEFNRLQLVSATDSYGREFDFTYSTFRQGLDGAHKLRLTGISFRGEELVSFGYENPTDDQQTYLVNVERKGMAASLQPATPIDVSYEYSRLFGVLDSHPHHGGNAQDFANSLKDCLFGTVSGPLIGLEPGDGTRCDLTHAPPGMLGSTYSAANLSAQIDSELRDNIIRVRRAGEIDLEIEYGSDPTSPDYDRVVAQRFGAVPTAEAGADPEAFLTTLPLATFQQVTDADLPSSYPSVAAAVPLEVIAPGTTIDPDPHLPGACANLEELDQFDYFAVRTPSGDRPTLNLNAAPSLARTSVPCASIAARHMGDAFMNDLQSVPDATDNGERREALEWDMNLVCRWVERTDRVGARHLTGFNFSGVPLVEAEPSPVDDAAVAVTLRRVTADGLTVSELEPDGRVFNTGYAGRINENDPASLTRNFVAADAMTRGLPEVVIEHASGSLEQPVDGLGNALSSRTWEFAYDPAFQTLVSTTTPDGFRSHTLLDYQQLPPSSDEAQKFRADILERTGALIFPSQFLGVDLDGDGLSPDETSSGPVVSFTDSVDLGGGARAPVGQRHRRDRSGRIVEDREILDPFDATGDFNFVEYTYYEDLDHAEAGDLEEDCDFPRGPIGRTRRLRDKSSSQPSDRTQDFVAYDPIGGVRLEVGNDDDATTTITKRNSLGLVFEQDAPEGLVTTSEYDLKGQLVRSTSFDARDGSVEPRVTVIAWGLQGISFGSCTEIAAGACDTFADYAVTAIDRAKHNIAPAAPLADASYTIQLLDDEDRDAGGLDAAGGHSTRLRGAAGLVRSQIIVATPPEISAFSYDVAGRLVAERHGSGSERIMGFFDVDGFGRTVAAQSLAPLSQAAFVDGVGTISRTRFDLLDRPVLTSVVGDDGVGHRRVLDVSFNERNEAGLARFVHRGALAQTAALPPLPHGTHANDGFVTEEIRYDAALRPVFHSAEGIAVPTFASYDGLGLREVNGLHATASILVDPHARTTTVDRVGVAEVGANNAPSAIARASTEIDVADGRGLVVQKTLTGDDSGSVPRTSTSLFDGLGLLRGSVDAAGRRVAYEYDRAGRMTASVETGASGTPAAGRRTEFILDAMGRVTSRRPVNAPETITSYDLLGRVTSEASGTFSDSYFYDSAGRTVERTTATAQSARELTFTFDPGATRPHQLLLGATALKTWLRDGLERPVSASDANAIFDCDGTPQFRGSRPVLTTDIRYDMLGRVVEDKTLGQFPASSPTLPRATETLSDLVRGWGENFLGPSTVSTLAGTELELSYSPRGTLAEISRSGLGADIDVNFSSEAGLWVGAAVGPRWAVEKRRDAFGFVTGDSLKANGATLSRDDVLRGATGKIVGERTSGARFSATVRGYRYDDLGRVSEMRTDLNASQGASSFLSRVSAALEREDAGPANVSAADNVWTAQMTAANVLTATGVDENNRVYSAVPDAASAGVPPLSVNNNAVSRDGLDRFNDDTTLSYVFDALDRLALVKRGAIEEMRVSYDGLGRRRLERRRVQGAHGGIEDAVLEYEGANVIEETDANTRALFLATTHAPGIDAPLVATTGDGTFALQTNARGDVVAAALESGVIVTEEQRLDPWGEREMRLRNSTNACVEGDEAPVHATHGKSARSSLPTSQCAAHSLVLGRFGLGGARSHAGTKLVDLRNRVFAPHLRALLSRDPLGDVDSEGLFAYAAGDPINLRDPWGLTSNPIGANGGPAVTVNLGTTPANMVEDTPFVTDVSKPPPVPKRAGSPFSCDTECQADQNDARRQERQENSLAAGLAKGYLMEARAALEETQQAADPLAGAKAAIGLALLGGSIGAALANGQDIGPVFRQLNPFGTFASAAHNASISCVEGGSGCGQNLAVGGFEATKLVVGALVGSGGAGRFKGPSPNAIIKFFEGRRGQIHFSVETLTDEGSLHTHQVIVDEAAQVTRVEEVEKGFALPKSIREVFLPDVGSARWKQIEQLERGETGPHILEGAGANNCATAVCEVLSAGGGDAPADPSVASKYLRGVFGR